MLKINAENNETTLFFSGASLLLV